MLLKLQLQTQMNVAWKTVHTRNPPEQRIRRIGHWRYEICVVHGVQRFSSKLQVHTFCNGEVLHC